MSGKMNWDRAKKFKGSIEKYESGTVLSNGRVVHNQRDEMGIAFHAAKKKRGRKLRRYQPTPYDIERNPALASKGKR